MNNRRRAIIVLASVAIIGVLTLVMVIHPLAQQPSARPTGPSTSGRPMPGAGAPGMMGSPGMMGAVGGTGRATNLRWEEHKMPKEKTMTYPEWLNREGQRPVAVPKWFLREKDGKPQQYTDAEWYQLQALYAAGKVGKGGPGSKLSSEVQKQLVVQQKEATVPEPIYEAGLNHFYFRVTYPTYNIGQVTATGTTISLDAIMQVTESLSRNYGELVRKKLAPYSNPGPNRSDFYLITYQRGYWRPYHFQLLPETISELNRLWAGNTIKMELLDRSGDVIASQTQSAGHSAETINEIAYPPEIDLNPSYEYLTEAQRIDFAGNKLQIHNIHGWRYTFSFTLNLRQLARLDKVRVQLLDSDGDVRSESTIVGTHRAPYAGLLSGAAAAGPGELPSVGMPSTMPSTMPGSAARMPSGPIPGAPGPSTRPTGPTVRPGAMAPGRPY